MAINQDVLDINEAIERYGATCSSIGYLNRVIEDYENRDYSDIDDDEADRVASSQDRLIVTRDSFMDSKTEEQQAIKRAFEHYYS